MVTSRNFKLSSFRRFLNLQEYQSKELMNKFGLVTQKFKIISEPSEAEKVARDLRKTKELRGDEIFNLIILEAAEFVVKAQILSGGRGKGTFSSGLKGGVQLTKE